MQRLISISTTGDAYRKECYFQDNQILETVNNSGEILLHDLMLWIWLRFYDASLWLLLREMGIITGCETTLLIVRGLGRSTSNWYHSTCHPVSSFTVRTFGYSGIAGLGLWTPAGLCWPCRPLSANGVWTYEYLRTKRAQVSNWAKLSIALPSVAKKNALTSFLLKIIKLALVPFSL